jgi:hypothetical protein
MIEEASSDGGAKCRKLRRMSSFQVLSEVMMSLFYFPDNRI